MHGHGTGGTLRDWILLSGALCSAALTASLDAQGRRVEARRDSTGASISVSARRGALIEVTDEHRRTAFSDSATRDLFNKANAARFQQDSLLLSYDAKGYQRLTAGMSARAEGRDRIAYRREGAMRVQWQRDVGARVQVEGARAVVPIVDHPDATRSASREAAADMAGGAIRLPYFPGQESLWIGSDMMRAEATEYEIVHPFAGGAEAYYTYRRGDSVRYVLPDGKEIRLVEMLVKPRDPKWYVIVGSFWFDDSNHRLVRAAYRLAVPMDLFELDADDPDGADVPLLVRTLVSPMRATVNSITVEYALFEGQFWLPRLQTATGHAQAAFLRVPFELQQKFDYLSVNSGVNMEPIPITPEVARQDSLWVLDSLAAKGDTAAASAARLLRERSQAARDSSGERMYRLRERARAGDREAQRILENMDMRLNMTACDTSSSVSSVSRRYNRTVRVLTTVPCDVESLRNSPALPPSIFSPSEELFGQNQVEELTQRLGLGLQSRFSPQIPVLRYGLGDGISRYNRVEGFSTGLGLRQQLGMGLTLDALARMGTADAELNGEVSLARTNGRHTLQLGAYRRLVPSNDWGSPFTMGASLNALIFGRDEGFYYRAKGIELSLAAAGNPSVQMRLYGERNRRADVEEDFSIADALGSKAFPPNIVAQHGDVFGATMRLHHSLGEDPRGFRMLSDVRLENGMGDFAFGRGMFDVTLSHGITSRLGVGFTVSAGSSVGELPAQRHFLLGGTQSVRGQRAGTYSGDSFWMTRVELGLGGAGARRVLFADVGWAGARTDWSRQGRAMSGVGTGFSLLDGLLRMDLARGLYPSESWRFAMYLEGKF